MPAKAQLRSPDPRISSARPWQTSTYKVIQEGRSEAFGILNHPQTSQASKHSRTHRNQSSSFNLNSSRRASGKFSSLINLLLLNCLNSRHFLGLSKLHLSLLTISSSQWPNWLSLLVKVQWTGVYLQSKSFNLMHLRVRQLYLFDLMLMGSNQSALTPKSPTVIQAYCLCRLSRIFSNSSSTFTCWLNLTKSTWKTAWKTFLKNRTCLLRRWKEQGNSCSVSRSSSTSFMSMQSSPLRLTVSSKKRKESKSPREIEEQTSLHSTLVTLIFSWSISRKGSTNARSIKTDQKSQVKYSEKSLTQTKTYQLRQVLSRS